MAVSGDTSQVKARLSEFIGRVAYGRERLLVLRRGKPVAALVSVEDLRRLEALDSTPAERTPSTGIVAGRAGAHPIMRAFGGWAGRDDLDELVEEIYADRLTATAREVAL
jgi:prevent-host-death family protein